VQRTRNRGVFVRVLTDQDLYDIYEVRAALEAEAFRTLAARGTVPPAVAEAVAQLKRLGSRAPQKEVVEADFNFHRAIVEGTGNQRLARAHAQLFGEMRLCLAQLVNRYASVTDLAAEHKALLQTIEAGDEARAEAAIRGHLQRATAWLVEQGTGRRRLPAGRS
jgi:DNA-binding GntR family transcriptional regulator